MSLTFAREATYAALFARVSAATWAALGGVGGPTTWGTKSRKLVHWTKAPLDAMPCLYQKQVDEDVMRTPNLPAHYSLHAELFVYVATLARQNSEIVPSSQLNVIMDAIEAALEPQPASGEVERTTLGGLVYECVIRGKVENFEGDLGDLGVLIVPVEIVVPT